MVLPKSGEAVKVKLQAGYMEGVVLGSTEVYCNVKLVDGSVERVIINASGYYVPISQK